MKVVMTQYDKTVTIEEKADDLDIYDVIEQIVRPMLLAIGYQKENVEEVLGEPR